MPTPPAGGPGSTEAGGAFGALEPHAERPDIPEYGVPDSPEGLLPWSWATERLAAASTYWVATTRPDGRPHVMPVWGAWLPDGFWWEGGLGTRRARNLTVNPAAVVTVEQGDDVVIIEGEAERVTVLPDELEAALLAAYDKYAESYGYRADPANWRTGGLWRLRPRVAFGWSVRGYPQNATRWRFPA